MLQGIASAQSNATLVSATDYPDSVLFRIQRYSGSSPCCLAIALVYLERLRKQLPGLFLNSKNFQRLFLIAAMTATKFLDDLYYSNNQWAKIGGLTLNEVNSLELEFLFLLDFRLHLQREEYDWYTEELLGKAVYESHPSAVKEPSAGHRAPMETRYSSSMSSSPCSEASVPSTPPPPEDLEAALSRRTTPKSSMSDFSVITEELCKGPLARCGGGSHASRVLLFTSEDLHSHFTCRDE